MIATWSKVNFKQIDDFSVISHKELATLLREVADMLDEGGIGKHHETAVGKVGEPAGITVDFSFTVDGEVRSVGISSGTK